jgi:hypothetical protein
MNPVHEDRFVVFIRADRTLTAGTGEAAEQPVASCSSYAEARRMRQVFHGSEGQFVIRYVGPAGGGD